MEIKRYDVVMADLGSSYIGSIQGGLRPVLIVQNNLGNLHSGTTIVMPLSSKLKKPRQSTHTLIRKDVDNGLKMDSILLGEQIRIISKDHIKYKLGSVTKDEVKREIRRVYDANFGDE